MNVLPGLLEQAEDQSLGHQGAELTGGLGPLATV